MKTPKNGHQSLYFAADRLLPRGEIASFTGLISVMVSYGPYLRYYRVAEELFGHPGHVIYYPTSRVKDGKVNFAHGHSHNPHVSDWRELDLRELEIIAIQHKLKAETH